MSISQVRTYPYAWLAKTTPAEVQFADDLLAAYVASALSSGIMYPIDTYKVGHNTYTNTYTRLLTLDTHTYCLVHFFTHPLTNYPLSYSFLSITINVLDSYSKRSSRHTHPRRGGILSSMEWRAVLHR